MAEATNNADSARILYLENLLLAYHRANETEERNPMDDQGDYANIAYASRELRKEAKRILKRRGIAPDVR